LCHAYNFQRKKNIFGARSTKCIFVGYPHGKKGWTVYDIKIGEIFVSRDVIFHEETYPYAHIEQKQMKKDVWSKLWVGVRINVGMSFLKRASHMHHIQGQLANPKGKHLGRPMGTTGCNPCLMMVLRQQGMLEVRS